MSENKILSDSNKQSEYKRLHQSYLDMRCRCNNPNYKHFSLWGGRGIKVCSKWNNDYQSFKSWALEHNWRPGLTIDRVDGNKGYSAKNCRWIPRNEQSLNLRNTNLYDCNGLIFSQRRLIEFLWTLEVGDTACIKKIKKNTMKVGNPYHNNHRNHHSK